MDLRSRILSFLCVFLFVWATTATYQYFQLKKNPLLIKLPDSNSSGLEALEKVNFLRQFSDRFLNYDRDNFWQTQLTLTSLMAPSLRQERKSEVQRMKDVIEKKSFSQRANLISIEFAPNFNWISNYQITTQENGKKEQFQISLHYEMTETERTMENPWGLLIQQIKTQNKSELLNNKNPKTLYLTDHSPLLMNFPCQVENIEVPNDPPIAFKLTTLNTTEVQVFKKRDFSEPILGKALCRSGYFTFQISSSPKENQTALLNFQESDLQKEVIKKKAKKTQEMKTIEEELGFVIEEK